MMFRAAIALLALALPVTAQRGGGHAGSAGSIGSHGFAGHAGFSGSAGFSQSRSFAQPAPYSTPRSAGYRGIAPPSYSRVPTPYSGNRFVTGRPAYASRSAALSHGAGASSGGDRSRNRDRDRWDARRRSFNNWYSTIYPAWLGYPYLIDPGFYDWGDSDDSADAENGAAPDYPAPFPDYGYGGPEEAQEGYPGELPPWNSQWQQPVAGEGSASLAPEEPLTVIFKNGRAPVKMQNYMMTTKVLTDLDAQHYEQIPLDEIDVAATQRANSAAGVGFEIPGA